MAEARVFLFGKEITNSPVEYAIYLAIKERNQILQDNISKATLADYDKWRKANG